MVEYKFKKGNNTTVLLTDNTLSQDNFAIIEAKHTEGDFKYDRSYLIGTIVNESFLKKQASEKSEVLEKWHKDNLYDVLTGLVITKTLPVNNATDIAKTGALLKWNAINGADKYIITIGVEGGTMVKYTVDGTVTQFAPETALGVASLQGTTAYVWSVSPIFMSGKEHTDTAFKFTTVA